jgi:hypothetical protein
MRRAVLALVATLSIGVVASGCDWVGTAADGFGTPSGYALGLGCNGQSCDWLSGNYVTVTITHTQSHVLLSVAENCINTGGLPGTCMESSLAKYLTGSFVGIEDNALLDSNCLYGVPPAGWCTSGYGTYGVSEYYTFVGYAFGGYDNIGGCVGFRINLVDLNYQSGSWFYTGPFTNGGDPPGGASCTQ